MSFLFPHQADSGQTIGDAILGAGDFGKDIPYVFGCYRVPGVEIWQQAHADVHAGSAGGKGNLFQPSAGSQTTYTGSCATAFCLPPDASIGVVGIRKLWQDNKLLYTVAEDATSAEITATSQIAPQLTFYLGTNTQGRDPVMVGRMGSDQTPAYRGIVYVVGANLVWSNGRAPSFTAEICHTGTLAGGPGSTLTRASTSLAYVFRMLCLSVGIPYPNIDVSEVTEDIRGISVSKGAVKDAIDSLCKYFNYGICQSGYTVKFYKIYQNTDVFPVFNIPYGDLGTQDVTGSASDSVVEALPLQETSEKDLPIMIRVKAKNYDSDYMDITGQFVKPTGSTVQVVDIDMGDFTATTTELTQVANIQTYKAWNERINSIGGDLPYSYLALEPGDAGYIGTGSPDGIVLSDRLTKVDIGANWIVQTVGVQHSANNFVSSAVGSIVGGGLRIQDAGTTTWEWMNIPPIHDAEASRPGVYVAATGLAPGWTSANLYQSKTGPSGTYAGVLSITGPAAIGVVASAAPDGSIYTFDMGAAITVVLTAGTLSSVTDAQLFVGANMCLIGGELMQFGVATLIAMNTYQLTRRLRGRRDTSAYTATHGSSENFVLLTDVSGNLATGVGFLECNLSDLNRVDNWKMVPNGHTIDQETAQTHAITGVNMFPFAPVNIQTGLKFNGGDPTKCDLTITWQRCGRIGQVLTPTLPMPLGETSESYQFIMNMGIHGTITRTLSTPTFSYSYSDRAFDWGAGNADMTGATITVAQISSSMGVGYSNTLTLTTENSVTGVVGLINGVSP